MPGRPTKCTQEVVDAICPRLADGESLRSICADDHIPVMSTVLLWVVQGRIVEGERFSNPRDVPKVSGIYALLCPVSGDIRYIGQSSNVRKRFGQHLNLNSTRYNKDKWIMSLMDEGLSPNLEILEETSDLESKEVHWIEAARSLGVSLLNMNEGGVSQIHSARKAKEKMPWHPMNAPLQESLRAASRIAKAIEKERGPYAAKPLKDRIRKATSANRYIMGKGRSAWVSANVALLSRNKHLQDKYLPTFDFDMAYRYMS